MSTASGRNNEWERLRQSSSAAEKCENDKWKNWANAKANVYVISFRNNVG